MIVPRRLEPVAPRLLMSYRSIKRVLGETSLERKCRFLFGACLFVLITGSFWWYGRQSDRLVFLQNSEKGKTLVDLGMYRLHWNKLDRDKAFVYLMTEDLSQQDYRWEPILTELSYPGQPIPPQFRPRDDFEREVVQQYLAADAGEAAGEAPEFRERLSDDGNWYHYYQPIRAQASCYTMCHLPLESSGDPKGTLGHCVAERPGELMAVVRVTIANRSTQKAMDQNRAILITAAIITVALAMVAAYVIVRYVIVKPLKHLRDVSDAVGRGNTALRAEIHTGDEFEELAVAFNRMLRHLISAQEELRHVNADLDGKVDELAQANMQLYETNRIKSDFLATMSHELRTPLNSILGFSEVLGSIDALDEKQKRYVGNIQKSGRALLDMINNILDLAKIESGRAEIRLAEFPIDQVIGAQCDMARPLAEKKNIDLEAEIQPGLPPLHHDQNRLQQILNNLLSNAIKFTPEGGRITVSAHRGEEGELVLRVSDTGVGIAEEDLDTIFQKFRQGGNALADGDAMTREYSGTGLGLSIVKELCKLLGGEVSAESRLGKGSTFTVRLPWVLLEQPRLDSPVSDEFEQFTKIRPELIRGPTRS
ncbi:MAG: HAMP domain-containing protein [Pirellulales bacterium]|nr:HAMP domain-containing protein [Pirellulales bacterium]